jgi:hypothetical protein
MNENLIVSKLTMWSDMQKHGAFVSNQVYQNPDLASKYLMAIAMYGLEGVIPIINKHGASLHIEIDALLDPIGYHFEGDTEEFKSEMLNLGLWRD